MSNDEGKRPAALSLGLAAGAAFRVRPMLTEDLAGVIALAAGEPTAPHWPMFEYRRMLDVIAESPGRRGAWVLLRDSQPQAVHVVRSGPTLRRERTGPATTPGPGTRAICGFAMAGHVAGICELEAVVVEARWRGRRLGAALIDAVVAWGRESGASRLELEVRGSNWPALRLYRRLGFTLDGTRPGYYRNPDEEAVLMSLALQPEPGEVA